MAAVVYRIQLNTTTAKGLEGIANEQWDKVHLIGPVGRPGAGKVNASALLIAANGVETEIGMASLDVMPKLEVFRISALQNTEHNLRRRHQAADRTDTGELLSAFLGRSHQVLIGARRTHVPDWARENVDSLIVEDILIFRHHSGQHALITTNPDRPETILITRIRDDLESIEQELEYIRVL